MSEREHPLTDDLIREDPQDRSEPQDVLESGSAPRIFTRRRALLIVAVAAAIAVVAGGALLLQNDRATPGIGTPPRSVPQADAAADSQCDSLGYQRSPDVRLCHEGFVFGAMVVLGQRDQRWSSTTERNAANAATLVLNQSGAQVPPFGSRQMRSEPWRAGFKEGVIWLAEDPARQGGAANERRAEFVIDKPLTFFRDGVAVVGGRAAQFFPRSHVGLGIEPGKHASITDRGRGGSGHAPP